VYDGISYVEIGCLDVEEKYCVWECSNKVAYSTLLLFSVTYWGRTNPDPYDEPLGNIDYYCDIGTIDVYTDIYPPWLGDPVPTYYVVPDAII
jgi:hypothetical protein